MSGLSMEQPGQRRHAEVLRNVSLFGMLGSEELDDLSAQFEEVRFPKGAVVCSEGEPADTFYVIESGELEVWGAGEPAQPVSRLGHGDFFGEMALLLGEPRTATVTVARPARLLALDKESFQRVLGENPTIREGISKALCQRLASTTRGAATLFAFSTMISWSYYGLKGVTYLVGEGRAAENVFKLVFCIFVALGCMLKLEAILDFSDALVFLICVPNLFGLYVLSPVLRARLRVYAEAEPRERPGL